MKSLVVAALSCAALALAVDARAASLHTQFARKMGVGHSQGYHAQTCCTGCAPYSNGVRRCYTPVYICGPYGPDMMPTGEYLAPPEPARAAQIPPMYQHWSTAVEVIEP